MEPKKPNQGELLLWKHQEECGTHFSGKLEIPVSMLPVLMELAADGRESIDLLAIGWLNKSNNPAVPRMIGRIDFPVPGPTIAHPEEIPIHGEFNAIDRMPPVDLDNPNWDELPY